jgi:hypothetical protein
MGKCEVNEIADADGERNDAKRGGHPRFRLVPYLSDQSKRQDVTERSAHQKNGGAPRARRMG